ncbi:MAG: hypothetical protein ACOY3I_03950 [Verrucomicrobiota bacterium]
MNVDSINGVKVSMALNKSGKSLGSVSFVGNTIEKKTASEEIVISSSDGNAISLELEDLIAGQQCSYYQGPIIHERINQGDQGIYFANSQGEIVKRFSFENQQDYTKFLRQLTYDS